MAPLIKATMVTLSLFFVLLAFCCSTVNLQTIGHIPITSTFPSYGSVQGSRVLPSWGSSWQQSPYDYNSGYYTGRTYYRTGRESAPQGCASAWAGSRNDRNDATGGVTQRGAGNDPQPSQQSSRAAEQQGALWVAMHQAQQSPSGQQPQSPQSAQQLSRGAEQPADPAGDTHPNKDQFMREQTNPPFPNYSLLSSGIPVTHYKQPQAWVSYSRLSYPVSFQQRSTADSGHPVAVLPDELDNSQGQGKASNAWGVSSNDAHYRSAPGSVNIKWVVPGEEDKILNVGRASQQITNPAIDLNPAVNTNPAVKVTPAINQHPLSRQLFLTNPTAFLTPASYQVPQPSWGYNTIPANTIPAERILPPDHANVAYSQLPPLPHQTPPSGILAPVTGVIYDPSLMRRIYGDSNYVPPVFSLTNELSNRTRKIQQNEMEYNKVLHGEKPLPFIPARESGTRQSQANQLLPPNLYNTQPWAPKTNLYVEAPVVASYGPAGPASYGPASYGPASYEPASYEPVFQPPVARADNPLTPHCRQKRQIGNFWDIYPALLPDSPLQEFEAPYPGQMSQRSMDPLSSLTGLLHTPPGQLAPPDSPWSLYQNPSFGNQGQNFHPSYYPMQSRGAAQGFQQIVTGLSQMMPPLFTATGLSGLK